ncbi:MAG: response regulator, partial [Magnetococcales bacterium]|nr:response regulator [Magnetococcales bacterium]
GALDFISKPIDAQELVAKINVILRDKESIDRLRRQQHHLEDMVDVRTEALRESEEKFRQMTESIQEMFWLREVDTGQLLYVSPAYETLWGRPVGALYRHPDSRFDAVHPDDRPRVRQAMADNPAFCDLEYRVRHADGSQRWIHERSFPVADQSGSTYRIAGVAVDVTGHKMAEERSRKLEGQLFQTRKLEAIGIMAGGIAHDFNNILSGIIGFTEMALRGVEHVPLVKNQLNAVLEAGLRAAELVRQILTFSRETGPMPLEPVLVAPLFKETVKLLRTHLPDHIELHLDLDPEAGPVLCQPIQMQQILMNLFTNAVMALKEVDDAVLTIGLGNDVQGQVVELWVSDNGTGMSEETLGRIFDPFFTTRPHGEGTGLGLSIVYGIVQSLGGTIHAESRPRQGSRFQIRLPRASRAEACLSGPTSAPFPDGDSGKRILLVDNDIDLVYLLKSQLQQGGYQVTGTTSSQDAWRRFLQQRDFFDLLVTDMVMAERSGIQLARQFQQVRPGFPVVLISGSRSDLMHEELAAAGVRQTLAKPFLQSALLDAVRKALA